MPHLGTDPPQPLLALPGPRHCYRYDGEFTIAGQPIVVHQEGGQGRGTGWAVWDAAATLALYLEAAAPQLQSELRPGAAILELGSGTGLAGLAAAAALRRPAVLTDLPDVLPALQRNVDANPQVGGQWVVAERDNYERLRHSFWAVGRIRGVAAIKQTLQCPVPTCPAAPAAGQDGGLRLAAARRVAAAAAGEQRRQWRWLGAGGRLRVVAAAGAAVCGRPGCGHAGSADHPGAAGAPDPVPESG